MDRHKSIMVPRRLSVLTARTGDREEGVIAPLHEMLAFLFGIEDSPQIPERCESAEPRGRVLGALTKVEGLADLRYVVDVAVLAEGDER